MHKIGSIIKQINKRNKMETQTFECKFKRAFEKDNGGVTLYITKDDGTDMTIYGEALGTSRWQQGAKLKIVAQPVRTSKNGKQYQTATSIENLDGEVAVPENNMVSPQGVKTVKDLSAQWKEKYRLTMSNLLASWLSSGKELTPEAHKTIDLIVRDILDAKYDGEVAPF
jgi:hypothetical protein|tara:strand:+ start:408 stop:914 length:507 start_codon:yes stop_codon:yes gene_type:complete